MDPKACIGEALLEKIKPYARVRKPKQGGTIDFRRMPLEVEEEALAKEHFCADCGKLIHPFRRRQKANPGSDNRIAGSPKNGALYYSPTCPIGKNPACCRSKSASNFKDKLNMLLGGTLRTGFTPERKEELLSFLRVKRNLAPLLEAVMYKDIIQIFREAI